MRTIRIDARTNASDHPGDMSTAFLADIGRGAAYVEGLQLVERKPDDYLQNAEGPPQQRRKTPPSP